MAAVSVFLKSGDGIIIGGEPGPLLNFYQGLLCGETPFVELVEPNGTARMAVRRDDVASVLYDAAADGNAVVFSQVVRLQLQASGNELNQRQLRSWEPPPMQPHDRGLDSSAPQAT